MSRTVGASMVPVEPCPFAGLAWLAAVVVVLWPIWSLSAARFLDGSDEPLGLVAIGALAVLTTSFPNSRLGSTAGATQWF